MVYSTENGDSLQKLSGKSQISGKIQWILLQEIEKKESKTRNTFHKLLEQISQSPQFNQNIAGRARAEQREKMCMRNLPRTSQPDISANTGTTPK